MSAGRIGARLLVRCVQTDRPQYVDDSVFFRRSGHRLDRADAVIEYRMPKRSCCVRAHASALCGSLVQGRRPKAHGGVFDLAATV